MKKFKRGTSDHRNALRSEDKVFSSAKEVVSAIDGLVRFLNQLKSKRSGGLGGISGFLVERLDVKFTSELTEIEIQTNYAQNLITIRAPLILNESVEEMNARRIGLLKDFLPALKEAQFRSTVQLYKLLKSDVRKALGDSGGDVV